MAKNNEPGIRLWDGITDEDFYSETFVQDEDIASYDLDKMKIFSANINYFRQIIRLSDSLKPVERRILVSMYEMHAVPGSRTRKCSEITGNTMKVHAHGTASIYSTMVNMSQMWKRPIPLIKGKGNFGNSANSDLYAADRYTEATMSKYAYECFFDDYDPDCIEMIHNTSSDAPEPLILPAKFPNILVNGGVGIAIGNAFRIPPYNVYDVVDLCKRLMVDEHDPNIYILPDLPTGCDIVDDGETLRAICDTGEGVLKMRATAHIGETLNTWVITFTNVPWLVSLESTHEKIINLSKEGKLQIKEVQNHSYSVKTQDVGIVTVIDYRIIIDKAHDPYVFLKKLYKLTDLEKTVSVMFKVVKEGFEVAKLNMRDLVLSWLDERREYKRRLLNKKISKLHARIAILEILLHLTESDNINKTIRIIRTNNLVDIAAKLREFGNMSSYQASKIADMKLSAFTKDAHQKYLDEVEKCRNDLEATMELIRSEKKIDKLILSELDQLKKYGSPRKSKVISNETGIKISNTDHIIITTKQGRVKKLPVAPKDAKFSNMGTFANGDYPTQRIKINNLDAVVFFDSNGKFSTTPVSKIENTEPSNMGHRIFDITKLEGEIMTIAPTFTEEYGAYIKETLGEEVFVVSLSKNGYVKKTALHEFVNLRGTRNIRFMKLKEDDRLVSVDLILEHSNLMVYTKSGHYAFVPISEFPTQGKDSMGASAITLHDGDVCVGMKVIGVDDTDILVVTEKGFMKKCELEFMGSAGKRKMSTSYITTVDPNDAVFYVNGVTPDSKIIVCTRTAYHTFYAREIPSFSRKAKGQKMIPLPVGNNIISVDIE